MAETKYPLMSEQDQNALIDSQNRRSTRTTMLVNPSQAFVSKVPNGIDTPDPSAKQKSDQFDDRVNSGNNFDTYSRS